MTDRIAAQIEILEEVRDDLRARAARGRDRLPTLDRLQEVASRRVSGLEESARVLETKIRDLKRSPDYQNEPEGASDV